MEPLAVAALAALTPKDVDIRFYDDRCETLPYDEPTDLVAMSVETYTARRSYQIASEYRSRGVRVIMGGFHASLCTDEVSRHAEAVVVGEAEHTWGRVIDDARHGTLQGVYRNGGRPDLAGTYADRSIFKGKRYLPIGLIETGRGCPYACDFCAVQTMFERTQTKRPIDEVVEEVRRVWQNGNRRLIFFVDDNVGANSTETKELLRKLIPLRIRWVSQCSIHAARDDEFLDLLRRSGCECVLIGLESLDAESLGQMNKPVNMHEGGYGDALENLRRHKIRVYGTFVFGYDPDTIESFDRTVQYALDQGLFMAAFAHVAPFPGTPLYRRLESEGRLLSDAWWNDPDYCYNDVAFRPKNFNPAELKRRVFAARKTFFSWPNIIRRGLRGVNRTSAMTAWLYFLVNSIHRRELYQRDGLPLGDPSWRGAMLQVQ